MNLETLTDTERRLVSACLIGGTSDVLAATSEGLEAKHFSTPDGVRLWTATIHCAMEGGGLDLIGLARYLQLDPATAVSLHPLDGMEPTSARRKAYTAEVIANATRRKVTNEVGAAQAVLASPDPNWTETWERVDQHLRNAQLAAVGAHPQSLGDHVKNARAALDRNERPGCISSPFPAWDRVAGRMAAGDLAVLAARPGCGKTALALQYARGVVDQGHGVLFASLEMLGDQLVGRLAQQQAGRPGEIISGMDPRDLASAKRARSAALDDIGKLDRRLFIGEPKECGNLSQIEARARLLAQTKAGLALIIIDYLQLLTVPHEMRREHRERQVAELSRRTKEIALALKIPVLLLAQLNRESERDERRPRLSDLRESGAIEQDADFVWFLYPKKENAPASDALDLDVTLFQAKARHGPPGLEAVLRFRRPHVRFYAG